MFGLFMVLTFTWTFSATTSNQDDLRRMIIAAIGCNIAWGFTDALMYVLRNLVARGRKLKLIRDVRASADSTEFVWAHRLISDEIGDLADGLDSHALERMRKWLVTQPEESLPKVRVTWRDVQAALLVFLLVLGATLPPILPFIIIKDDMLLAKRISFGIAAVMIFLNGFVWGKYSGISPWLSGFIMVVVAIIIQVVIIVLGG